MIGAWRYRMLRWGAMLGSGVVAVILVCWLWPGRERIFVVDESWSDLMRSAREGDVAETRRLLEMGNDPNARGGSLGLTPLIVSVANGHRDVVELLLNRGASIEAPDGSGMTPLMTATLFEQSAVAQLLLDRGADANASLPANSMTALMFAHTPAMARILLLAGADARVRTQEGRTAADHAENMGQSDLAELLRLAERQPTAPNTAPAPAGQITGLTAFETPNQSPRTAPDAAPTSHRPSPGRRPEVRLDGGEVPRVTLQNPISGFSIVVPEDWEMATGSAGHIEIAIDAPTGASLRSQPAVWFFRAPNAPRMQAELLARDLRRLDSATTDVRTTGQDGPWEVRATFVLARLGRIWTSWRCCQERGTSYVVAAAVREDLLARYQDDIEAALTSCRLISHPTLQVFGEPSEAAYSLSLPQGWRWEGRIVRTSAIPGYFEWKAQCADELVGCFTAEPAVFNIATPYFSPDEAAGGIVLERLRTILPDVQLAGVQELPRVEQCMREAWESLMPGSRPQGGKVRADYIATRNGIPIRLRLDIATWMPNASTAPGMEGRGNWFLFSSGTWAPDREFDEGYRLARGVQSSVLTSSEWKRRQGRAVEGVLTSRRGVLEEASEGWDALVRGMERVPDPDGGPVQEVPNLEGQVWKDPDGKMWRVSPDPDTEAWVRSQNWTFVR